jgi:hypothetical protein
MTFKLKTWIALGFLAGSVLTLRGATEPYTAHLSLDLLALMARPATDTVVGAAPNSIRVIVRSSTGASRSSGIRPTRVTRPASRLFGTVDEPPLLVTPA